MHYLEHKHAYCLFMSCQGNLVFCNEIYLVKEDEASIIRQSLFYTASLFRTWAKSCHGNLVFRNQIAFVGWEASHPWVCPSANHCPVCQMSLLIKQRSFAHLWMLHYLRLMPYGCDARLVSTQAIIIDNITSMIKTQEISQSSVFLNS